MEEPLGQSSARHVGTPHLQRRVTVAEYARFRSEGFLVVPGLLASSEVDELRQHTEDLMDGRLPEQTAAMPERDTSRDTAVTVQGLEAPPANLSREERAQYFLRIHMLHRRLELHERFLLHPRVLDVLEALIGPDVLALQSMLFIKGPGKPGQGWHQDSYYIPTHPDTLCGAWMSIDDADEVNGAMWMAAGSQREPVYPPAEGRGYGTREVGDIQAVAGVSDPNDARNDLSRVADRYPHLLAATRPGDVVFFGGHVLHRSKQNRSADKLRRSFVGHYCNARSFTQWGADTKPDVDATWLCDPRTGMTNGSHILARGDTHLPFAEPRFGTPCAALQDASQRRSGGGTVAAMMGDGASGLMGEGQAGEGGDHA